MNNRGQSLVLFVLVIPIILLILVMVVDIGKMVLKKTEMDNINKLAISYGLDKIDSDPYKIINDIIRKNNSDINIKKIDIKDEKIEVKLEEEVKFILFKNSNLVKINSNYIGYIDNNKKVIERN